MDEIKVKAFNLAMVERDLLRDETRKLGKQIAGLKREKHSLLITIKMSDLALAELVRRVQALESKKPKEGDNEAIPSAV